MRARQYSVREFQTILRQNGFEPVRCKGDHQIYKRNNQTISIPIVGELNKMMTKRLVKENGLIF